MTDYGDRFAEKTLTNIEREINKIYRETEETAREKLDEYLKPFAARDKAKQAEVKAGTLTERAYKQWRTREMMTGWSWAALRKDIARTYLQANQQAMSLINGRLRDVYAENHNFAAYTLEHETGYNLQFPLM